MAKGDYTAVGAGPVHFFFPFRSPSGVSNLFQRLAEHLADFHGLDVSVIDYPDGQMAQNLSCGTSVKLVPFQDGIPCSVPPEATLVMQSMIPYAVRPELQLNPDCRVILWHFLFASLVNSWGPFPGLRAWQLRNPGFHRALTCCVQRRLGQDLRSYVERMAEHRSILFQDRFTAEQSAEFLGFRLGHLDLLPVCVDVPPYQGPPERQNDGWLRFGWIGRLYDFKIHILLHTLQRMSELAARRRQGICFTVVGDGDHLAMVDPARFEHAFFKLVMTGAVESRLLPAIIWERMDAVAAMGTSALEAARLGIPALLLDYTLRPLTRNYRYKWLFQAESGDIGHDILPGDYEFTGDSLNDALEALLEDRLTLGRQCYDYCLQTHSMEAIGHRFVDTLGRATFRFRDTPPLLTRRNWVRRWMERRRYGWYPARD